MKLSTISGASAQKVPEKAIQAAIVRRLSAEGWLTIRINSSAFKTDSGHYVRGYSIAGLSVSAGFPDVVAFKGNQAPLLIECKTEDGRLTEPQKTFHKYALERGVVIHVLRHPDELGPILAERGDK